MRKPLFCSLLLLTACRASTESSRPAPAPPETSAAAEAPPPSAQPIAAPPAKRRPPAREGSTIALAPDGRALYVADEDRGFVQIVSLPLRPSSRPLSIAVPGQPAQVIALADRVLVTIRSAGVGAPAEGRAQPQDAGPGLLLTLRPDADRGLVEAARVELPEDAWGVAVTPDGATAIVTSAWTHRVSAVDLATSKIRWSTNVRREPRAVVVRPDGRAAYVTHLVGAALTRLDDLDGTPRARTLGLLPSPLRTPVGARLSASLAYAAALSPDGRRLYVPRHALGAIGSKAWFGASTVDVLLTHDDSTLAPLRGEAGGLVRDETEGAGYFERDPMGPGAAPGADPMLFAQPRAIAYVHRSDTLLVAAEGSNTLVELDARALDPTLHPLRTIALAPEQDKPIPIAKACGAPSGIALSDDESTAYVHCRATDDVVAVALDGPPAGPHVIQHLSEDPLSTAAALGRRIFYDATDRVTSGGLACAGCHPEGRDDGHVWHETTAVPPAFGHARFVSSAAVLASATDHDEGVARQTPMLAGRVDAEGPYGWHGESATLVDRLVGGFELHRWDSAYAARGDLEARARALAAFLREGLVPPPRRARELSAKEKRGQEIFLSDEALCWTCHPADSGYTNRKPYEVFSQVDRPDGFAAERGTGFKKPSLRFVGGTAPYAHDGRFPTLAALVEDNHDQMGKTSHLSAADKAALIAFLETL
jgi:DNA-binding beta-propeller fold protein YncE